MKIVFVLVLLIAAHCIQAQTISTIAGTGTAGFAGDLGSATAAQLNLPTDVTLDGSMNVYIADFINNRIRKVNVSGTISTIAGNGTPGFSGDGGNATACQLNAPQAIAVDPAGNIYIADAGNHRIRKVSATGTVTTFAGTGVAGYSGDAGQATLAMLNTPFSVAIDGSGNVYLSDPSANRVRKITTAGIITTVAGNGTAGYSGDGGPAAAAMLSSPAHIALDLSGNLYIADLGNNRIRKVASGTISTIAGTGTFAFSGDGGPATAAELKNPSGMAVDNSFNVYFSQIGDGRIRMINTSGIISTIAGNGNSGFSGDGGPATAAQLNTPQGIALDGIGGLFIADENNNRIRKLAMSTLSIRHSTALNDFVLLPNPNEGSFVIKGTIAAAGSVNVEIMNMLGQVRYSQKAPLQSGSLNLRIDLNNNLTNGMYILRLWYGNENTMRRFVIEK